MPENIEEFSLIQPESEPLLQSDARQRKFKFTVEFPYFLVLFSSALTGGVTYNLLLYRTCINDLHYNETKCELLHSFNKTAEAKTVETDVEEATTFLVMILSMFSGLIPAILSVFLGSWSDQHGRKALVTWPLFGQFVSSVLVVIYCAIPSLNSWWFIVCTIPFTCLGGSTTLGLGTTLLITDRTNDSNRSFRLAVIQGCGFVGVLIGSVISSDVYEAVGYIAIFTVSTTLYFISYLYTLVSVDESLIGAKTVNFRKLFDWSLLKSMAKVCFKNRPIDITAILFFLISAYGITMFCIYGVGNIDYLFTRQKFQWLLKEYNIFSAVNTIIIVFGMFIGMKFLQSVCKMSDGFLLILAYLSSISEAVVRCLSRKAWQMYLAGTLSMLGGLSIPLIKSQVAKIVPSSEVGRMYSLISCVEAILPVFSPLLFNTLYFNTLATFPGAIYAVTAGLLCVCLVFITSAEILFYRRFPSY